MRFIAHHLLHICSPYGAFNYLAHVAENSELFMELAPLLAAKKELGESEGLADQLQLDQDLPPSYCLEAVSNTILAWRNVKRNLSCFSWLARIMHQTQTAWSDRCESDAALIDIWWPDLMKYICDAF